MTAQPAAPRRAVRRAVTGIVVLLMLSGWLYLMVGEQWRSSVVTFAFDESDDYRIRITGSFGVECAKLEREEVGARYFKWPEAGLDCSWPRLPGGDGWLAGGQIERVHSDRHGRQTPDWIVYGLVPAAAVEVEITLSDRVSRRIATREVGEGANRLYAQHIPGLGDGVEVVGLRLRDAQGGELRVY